MPLLVLPDYVPFFSVIVCTYNRRTLVERAIRSLLEQTEHDWEAIVVDDGSQDDSYLYLHDLCERDARFRMVYMRNRGQALAKNVGILNSTGLYITFLDSDDEYKSDHLAVRKQVLCEHPTVDLLHGGLEIVGDPYVTDMHDTSQRIHLRDCVVGGTFFVRRTTALSVEGFPHTRYGDDTMFYQRVEESGATIATIDVPTYVYHRETPDSLCTTMLTDKINNIIE